MTVLRQIFLTRHRELRSGWKILLFFLLTAVASIGIAFTAGPLLRGVPAVGEFLALGIALGASWVMTRTINGKPLAAIGLWLHPKALREFGIGMLIGFLMMSGIVIVQFASGSLALSWRAMPWEEALGTAALAFVLFALAAMTEELLFRGYPFQTLIQGITLLPAVLVMSGLFGIAHGLNPHATPLSTANVFLAGAWLSLAYVKTRGLWLPLGLHLSWNFTQTTVYGFPTSGLQFVDRTVWVVAQTGPEWVTGGSFGPEGGVLATVALLVGIWYVLKSRALTAPEGIVTLDTVEDLVPPVGREEGEQ